MRQTHTTPREITTAEAYRGADLRALAFTTTAELEPRATLVGQERAMQALQLGLGIPQHGYNIFVSRLASAGVHDHLVTLIREHARSLPTPGDWVYVHHFRAPDHPRALALDPGQGQRLHQDMARLVDHVRAMLPNAFRQEGFETEQRALGEQYEREIHRLQEVLGRLAQAQGFAIQADPMGGMVLIPVRGGRLMRPEEVERLSDAQRQDLEQRQHVVLEALHTMMRQQQQLLEQLATEIRQIECSFAASLIAPLIADLKQRHPQAQVHEYLEAVQEHMVAHLDWFKDGGPQARMSSSLPSQEAREMFLAYTVNVVVDNSDGHGAPVIIEDTPSYKNLFGTIERVVDAYGRVVTNFSRITAGSLLRASGGYVVLNLDDALTEPFVWKTLKRVLQSHRIQIDTYDPFALFTISALQPEAIPIQTKVIAMGSGATVSAQGAALPWLYDFLCLADPDLAQLAKIKADVVAQMDNSAAHQASYAHSIAALCRQESLRHCDRSAVEAVVEYGMRTVTDQQKLASQLGLIADLVREASYAAGQAGVEVVTRTHIDQAIQARIFRANHAQAKLQECIHRGTLLIDTTGRRVGQINGVSVVQLGAYAFGRPSRVTATTSMGRAGIVNIEREATSSDRAHDKGVLILSGYLHQMYAQDKPLTLAASLCFEQSYGTIEGDSASSTELYALLSRLANLPLRQDLAVTGAVNQRGEIQAIAGVNEQIEGFYDVCAQRGLTGQQGVLIPQANVRNLMLRHDVVEAIQAGRFHVYPITHIDQGLELLTGVPAGDLMTAGTVHYQVNAQLRHFATAIMAFRPEARHGTRPQPWEGLTSDEDV